MKTIRNSKGQFIKGCKRTDITGFKNPMWKGGKNKDERGYVRIKLPGKNRYIYEHRLVMENHIGRKLNFFEDVHHIDGNKSNNKVENLKIIRKDLHSSRHNQSVRCTTECFICGKPINKPPGEIKERNLCKNITCRKKFTAFINPAFHRWSN